MSVIDKSCEVPPWARVVWADHSNIFVAMPDSKGGDPYILKFERSDHGLGKALNMLRSAFERADRTNYTLKDDPRIKKAPRSFAFTQQQRNDASDIVRKMLKK